MPKVTSHVVCDGNRTHDVCIISQLTPDEDTVVSKRVGKIQWSISKKVSPFLTLWLHGHLEGGQQLINIQGKFLFLSLGFLCFFSFHPTTSDEIGVMPQAALCECGTALYAISNVKSTMDYGQISFF
jgi:hypothetical protein